MGFSQNSVWQDFFQEISCMHNSARYEEHKMRAMAQWYIHTCTYDRITHTLLRLLALLLLPPSLMLLQVLLWMLVWLFQWWAFFKTKISIDGEHYHPNLSYTSLYIHVHVFCVYI